MDMEQVPFERLEWIKRSLPDEVLPGLVAVFSKDASDDLLLVYIGEKRGGRPPQRLAISIAELQDANLAEYDGPTLGLAPIDLVRPDIATKGPGFVRLDRLLRRRGQVEALLRTWTELAGYLREHIDEIRPLRPDETVQDRAWAEIAAISAPQQIASMPAGHRRDMVAFVPGRGAPVRLGNEPLDALASLDVGPTENVVALAEVRPLLESSRPPHLRNHYPIELRTVLRRANLDADLGATLAELARRFHRRWQSTGARADCERAYAVALEIHLAKGDVDDLVAVLPDPDFTAFLTSGAGTYLYRRPLEGCQGRSPEPVRRRHLDDAADELARARSPVEFSLLPLRGFLGAGDAGRERWCDLGPVLRKSGRTEILARNAWLLVQDFLESLDRRTRFRVSPESLLETMTHCCAIFSLTDPWRIRQGRRNKWLLESYGTLHRVLQLLIQTGDESRRPLYTALDHWYGCAFQDGRGIAGSLERMVAALGVRPTGPSAAGELGRQLAALRELGDALLELLRGGGRAEAYPELTGPVEESIPQLLGRATDMARPLDLLSVPFVVGFRHYASIGDATRRTKAAQIPVRYKIERLAGYTGQLLLGRRLIFAPLHQARILDVLYERAITENQELVQRLQGGASLEVELRTHSIAPNDRDSGIVFSVANVGNVEAREIEIELTVSDAFELLDQSYKQALHHLPPEGEHRFRFAVRAHPTEETFPIRCFVSYWDTGQGRQHRTVEFMMRVAGLDRGPFHTKPNPYVFGLPLEEHHQFYGRRDELEQLLSHLANRRPQNVLLRGARRTGKTSLLNMVRSVLTDTDGHTGVRSWFGIPESWHPALDSTVPVFLNLQGIDWAGSNPTPTGFYHAVLAVLRDSGLRTDSSDMLLEEPTVTFTRFVAALRGVVHAAGDVRPVMLVDEFDVLDQIAEKSFFYGPLRTAISSVQGMTWIVASALGLYNEVRAYESPLFNVFKIIGLGLLEDDAARRLVLSPWERTGGVDGSPLRFADDAVEAILDEAGYYPYFVQLLCSEIVDYVNRTRSNYVQYSTVLNAIELNMITEGSATSEHFAYLWDRAGGVGKLILLALLHHPGPMSRAELTEAMQRLAKGAGPADPAAGGVEAFDDSMQRLLVVHAVRRVPGGEYAFGIPIFRRLLLKRADREDLERAAHDALAAEWAREPDRG
jgi:hypothetical protein